MAASRTNLAAIAKALGVTSNTNKAIEAGSQSYTNWHGGLAAG